MTLEFYPDNTSVLPHYEGTNLKTIDISNYIGGAQKLMGKALSQKAIAAAKAMLNRHLPGRDFGETLAVKGRATVVIEAYTYKYAVIPLGLVQE